MRPPELGLERRRQLDVLADDAAQHPLHARDDGVQVEHARLEDLPPAERQQLLRQRGGAAAGLPDLLGALAPRVALGELLDRRSSL